MHRYLAATVLLAGLAGAPIGLAAQETSGTTAVQLQNADKEFVEKAVGGGNAEVELGRIATEKAKSPEVKEFGQMMVDDHTKANDQLMQILEQKKVEVPKELPADATAAAEQLSGLSADEFDRKYMKQMVGDHEKTVELFQKQAESGQDPELKQFAEQTLPTLQGHLDQARRIEATMSQQAGTEFEAVEPAAGDTSAQQAARPENALTQMTADQLIGQSVVNTKGETVGKIEDIVLDKDRAVLAVLSVGGFLGIGDKNVAVPFEQLQPGEDETILLSAATEDQLKSMPAYEEGATGYEEYPRDQPLGGNP